MPLLGSTSHPDASMHLCLCLCLCLCLHLYLLLLFRLTLTVPSLQMPCTGAEPVEPGPACFRVIYCALVVVYATSLTDSAPSPELGEKPCAIQRPGASPANETLIAALLVFRQRAAGVSARGPKRQTLAKSVYGLAAGRPTAGGDSIRLPVSESGARLGPLSPGT